MRAAALRLAARSRFLRPPLPRPSLLRFGAPAPPSRPLATGRDRSAPAEQGVSAAKEMDQRLRGATGAGELIQVQAEHGGSYRVYDFATWWYMIGKMIPRERAVLTQ